MVAWIASSAGVRIQRALSGDQVRLAALVACGLMANDREGEKREEEEGEKV